MRGRELTSRLIADIEMSIAGREVISDYEEIKNCVDSVRNFTNVGSVFHKFSIAHTYDCQLRFDAMRLSFFLGTNQQIHDQLTYLPGEATDLPLLLDILQHEREDVARRFDVFETCSRIDSVFAYRYFGLINVLDNIHEMAKTIFESVEKLAWTKAE